MEARIIESSYRRLDQVTRNTSGFAQPKGRQRHRDYGNGGMTMPAPAEPVCWNCRIRPAPPPPPPPPSVLFVPVPPVPPTPRSMEPLPPSPAALPPGPPVALPATVGSAPAVPAPLPLPP